MYTYYKAIDENMLLDIHKYEENQLSKFKHEFDRRCTGISKLYGWHYVACIHRWIDVENKWGSNPLDGYTATLQIDFIDNNGKIVEIDESICSFFENITYISFNPLRRKYRVFQNEQLEDIRLEIIRFIYNLKTGDGTLSRESETW